MQLTVHKNGGRFLHPFDSIFNLDGFFGDLSRGAQGRTRQGNSPELDLVEAAQEIRVEIELPGVEEQDIEVSIAENVLTLKGEKRSTRESEEGDYRHIERSFGSFERQVSLPSEVDADGAEATFKRGVLTVRLPKSSRAQERRLEIKSAD